MNKKNIIMAFKSSFTSQEIEDRIKQGYYDDILQAGLDGNVFTDETKPSKQEMDLQLAKLGNGQQVQITKESVENVLTGNITTHRHDTTYQEKTFETDVWDGSSISSSLQGSGTADDPYLIQSCADWLHLYTNGAGQYNLYEAEGLETISEFKPVFKIVKNLDFGGKNIPEANTNNAIYACEIDGNNANFSNFEPSGNTGILPTASYSFFHNFNIDGFSTTINSSEDSVNIFSTIDLYSTILNCCIKVEITVNGDISEYKEYPCVLHSGGYVNTINQNMHNKTLDYINNNGDYYGINITLYDNTVKSNGAKMTLLLSSYFTIHSANIYISNKLDEFTFQEGVGAIVSKETNVIYMCAGLAPEKFYTNSEGFNTVFTQDYDGSILELSGTPKSLTEMQSESFVDELNSLLPKPAFKQDPEGGTPILVQYGQMDYDGYVKQSQFEKFKTEVSQNKQVVHTDINFFQNKNTGSPDQRFLTQDNFIEDLGGVDAVKEMTQLISDPNKIITSVVVAYVTPVLVTITNKTYVNSTKNSSSAPEYGDNFAFIVQAMIQVEDALYTYNTSCSVNNFNKENMSVSIKTDGKEIKNHETFYLDSGITIDDRYPDSITLSDILSNERTNTIGQKVLQYINSGYKVNKFVITFKIVYFDIVNTYDISAEILRCQYTSGEQDKEYVILLRYGKYDQGYITMKHNTVGNEYTFESFAKTLTE